MAVPDDSAVVHAVFHLGDYDLTQHEEQARYTDAVVAALHVKDAKWGHLKKKPGQTNIHGHAEDAALYKLPNNKAQAVDFTAGARGPNPRPYWNPDSNGAIYTHADWLDPADHEGAEPPDPPPPVVKPYPGDAVWDAVGAVLFADYAEAGQGPNPQMGRWFGRTIWDATEGDESGAVLTVEASITKHRKEWRAALGLP